MKKINPMECMILNIALKNKHPFTLNAIDIQAMVNEVYYYSPMPLTVDVLQSLGFKNDGNNNLYLPLPNGNASELCIEFDMGSTCLVRNWIGKQLEKTDKVNPFDFVYIKHLNYVHEVQNLYLFLTGAHIDTFTLLSKF